MATGLAGLDGPEPVSVQLSGQGRQSSHEWLTAAQIQHHVVVVVAVVGCMHLRLLGHRRLHTHSILFKT